MAAPSPTYILVYIGTKDVSTSLEDSYLKYQASVVLIDNKITIESYKSTSMSLESSNTSKM